MIPTQVFTLNDKMSGIHFKIDQDKASLTENLTWGLEVYIKDISPPMFMFQFF